MKPASFRYHAPKTLDEAVAVLAEVAPEDGRVLAGGQSLVPIMAFRLAKPSHLVDINGVAELARVTTAGSKLSIGACVRHAQFYQPICDGPLGTLLATVVRYSGISATIPFARAGPSAGVWRTLTRPPNGASSRPRWMPKWWRTASAADSA
jgi:hypothetical protein